MKLTISHSITLKVTTGWTKLLTWPKITQLLHYVLFTSYINKLIFLVLVFFPKNIKYTFLILFGTIDNVPLWVLYQYFLLISFIDGDLFIDYLYWFRIWNRNKYSSDVILSLIVDYMICLEWPPEYMICRLKRLPYHSYHHLMWKLHLAPHKQQFHKQKLRENLKRGVNYITI